MIEINDLTAGGISKAIYKKIVGKVLRGERKNLNLSIAFVSKARIKALNKKYRKINKPTDVLSFNYGSAGEIVICPEQVKKNAKEYCSPYKRELAKVLIHGILHLLSYDHEKSKKEAEIMQRKEVFYLKKTINI